MSFGLSELALNAMTRSDLATTMNSSLRNLERHMFPLMDDFKQWGCSESPTFKFWDMFLHAIEIMLQNIRAERQGLWDIHLSSVSAMLPFIFVTNRVHYSRWMPVYILDMLSLPPEVAESFESGQFAIRQNPRLQRICRDS
jgi:hypothetical protein